MVFISAAARCRFRFFGEVPAALCCLALGVSAAPAIAGDTTAGLALSDTTVRYGEAVTFTGTVTGYAPTGTVAFRDSGKEVGDAALDADAGASTTAAALSAGGYHTCALTRAGGAACWGLNSFGQIGDGNVSVDATVPVGVTGLSGGLAAVASGFIHSCALADAGTVKCWGDNESGQLGDGNAPTDSDTPVAVSGLSEKIVALAGGVFHTCALTEAGGVRCWGKNDHGQLGNGDLGVDSAVPVAVQGLGNSVAAIAAGLYYTCAALRAGPVKCWGQNSQGQLGDGTFGADRDTPVTVGGLSGDAVALTAGEHHTCALTENGAVECWGSNTVGQLGDDTASGGRSTTAVAVSGLSGGVAAIAAGGYHTCAITGSGALQCWGSNLNGQIGDGTTTDRHTPVDVDGFESGTAAVSGGYYHTCALTGTGAARCWGRGNSAQLGNGTTADSDTPVDVLALLASVPATGATATFEIDSLSAGTHKIKAKYDGDGNNDAASSDALTLTVKQGKTKVKSIKLTPKKPKAGETVTVKVKMKALSPAAGKPEGKVLVKDGKETLGKFKLGNGKASFKMKKIAKGTHKLTADYLGNANWKTSTKKKTVTVKK